MSGRDRGLRLVPRLGRELRKIDGSMRKIRATSETAHPILEVIEGTAFRHGIEAAPLSALIQNELEFIRAAISAS